MIQHLEVALSKGTTTTGDDTYFTSSPAGCYPVCLCRVKSTLYSTQCSGDQARRCANNAATKMQNLIDMLKVDSGEFRAQEKK